MRILIIIVLAVIASVLGVRLWWRKTVDDAPESVKKVARTAREVGGRVKSTVERAADID